MNTKKETYLIEVHDSTGGLYDATGSLAYPDLWLPPNREKKLKKGMSVVFNADVSYAMQGWMFTHNDDLNPNNNTHAGIIGAPGREFWNGNMTHKRCPHGSSQLFYPVAIYTHPNFNGSQSKLRVGDYSNLNNHHEGWANNIDSIKISANIVVTAWSYPNFDRQRFGPYRGPLNINQVYGANDWNSVKVELEENVPPFAEIFAWPNTDYSRKSAAIFEGTYPNLSNYNLENWANEIDSIIIPKGLKVTAWSYPTFSGKQYGPYIGPQKISLVDGPNDWDSMKVERY
ncbi:hypothetical protein EH221_00525 [bacterium]|nr:MAG: hypothetical protein EH221_00525 [bacterium]